jgi:MFS family permease
VYVPHNTTASVASDTDFHWQAWGIFLAYYLSNSTFPGATHLEYSLIGGLAISQALLISPLVHASNRKLGTWFNMLIGTVLVSLSMIGASFSAKIWHLFLSQGLLFGYGMGFLYITAMAVLPQWFGKKRSLAVGIAASGAGLGGLAYNLGASAAIESLGLKWTYRLLAFCTLTANLFSSLLLKDRNSSVRPRDKVFNFREYGYVEVILVITWGFLTELGYIVLLYSLPNYASSVGLSARQGSVIGALLNLGLAVGRPIVGFCSDAFGHINVAAVMTAACGFLCLVLWIPAKTYPVLLIFAITSGTAAGTFWGCVTPVTTEVVGLQRLPSAFSMICLLLVLPTTFAEPIALQIASQSGYLASQIFVGCMFFGGAASVCALRSWKICEVRNKAHRERQQEFSHSATGEPKKSSWISPRWLFTVQKV